MVSTFIVATNPPEARSESRMMQARIPVTLPFYVQIGPPDPVNVVPLLVWIDHAGVEHFVWGPVTLRQLQNALGSQKP